MQFRTSLMLGVTLLAAGIGAAASAQGYRIDQMPGPITATKHRIGRKTTMATLPAW
jgi:hypothetical protein